MYVQLTVDVICLKLEKNLQPFLEALGDVSALSETKEGALSTRVWRALQPQLFKSAGSLQVPDTVVEWELPLLAKFLLIAAYIASYNPPKSDRRFFLKQGEKKKISRRELRWGDRKSAHVAGPSAFPLERMLAIFLIIVGKPLEITVEIFGLVGTLRTLGYVSQTSNECNLDSIRLRCLATYETKAKIERNRFLENAFVVYFVCLRRQVTSADWNACLR
ncbi:ORC5 C domain containing protein [Trichuris trichiura]|uniref:ORC5 C domain containing protein n=1 Tax=Trichuris trichiura TaxID=36087 RepID=A0A077Z2Q5_TRITR|nr:ORC5 C domain containing protein [Trichuris trichiura]